MTRSLGDSPPSTPDSADLADFEELRATLAATLEQQPVQHAAVRTAVWTYVGAQRHAGTRPGVVIMALTDLLETASITPLAERQALTRRVILWCVEAYFGHLGGDVVGRDGMALSDTGAHLTTKR
jgi:hypothetical protein